MNITPFKNRELDESKAVELYRCLNRKGFVFSLRQNGKVVGHTNNIVLKNCKFIISNAGKQRCINNKVRNVHAYVEGYLGTKEDIKLSFSFELLYNPYKDMGFHFEQMGIVGEVKEADVLYFDKNNKRLLFQL